MCKTNKLIVEIQNKIHFWRKGSIFKSTGELENTMSISEGLTEYETGTCDTWKHDCHILIKKRWITSRGKLINCMCVHLSMRPWVQIHMRECVCVCVCVQLSAGAVSVRLNAGQGAVWDVQLTGHTGDGAWHSIELEMNARNGGKGTSLLTSLDYGLKKVCPSYHRTVLGGR